MEPSRRSNRPKSPSKHKYSPFESAATSPGAAHVDEPLKKTPRLGRKNDPKKKEKPVKKPEYHQDLFKGAGAAAKSHKVLQEDAETLNNAVKPKRGEKVSVAPPNYSPLPALTDSSDEDTIVDEITKKTSNVRRSLFSGGEESVGAPLKLKAKSVEKESSIKGKKTPKQSKGKWHVSPFKQPLLDEKGFSPNTRVEKEKNITLELPRSSGKGKEGSIRSPLPLPSSDESDSDDFGDLDATSDDDREVSSKKKLSEVGSKITRDFLEKSMKKIKKHRLAVVPSSPKTLTAAVTSLFHDVHYRGNGHRDSEPKEKPSSNLNHLIEKIDSMNLWPILQDEELDRVDKLLKKDRSFRENTLEIFKKKKCQEDPDGTIHAIMNFALGYRLGREFTTFGGRGRRNFSERPLYLYIKVAAQDLFPDLTDKEVEGPVGLWLTRAKDARKIVAIEKQDLIIRRRMKEAKKALKKAST